MLDNKHFYSNKKTSNIGEGIKSIKSTPMRKQYIFNQIKKGSQANLKPSELVLRT